MKKTLLGAIAAVTLLGACDRLISRIPIARNISDTGKANAECDRLDKVPITLEEEEAVGDAVAVPLARQAGGIFLESPSEKPGNKTELTAYLNKVGKNLASYSTRPEVKWSFGVLESQGVNAFSTPGGRVFVTRGLLNQISSEAELAGVLGHEIAHVTNQHGIKTYRYVKKNSCKQAALGAFADTMVSSVRSNISSSMTEILSAGDAAAVNLNLAKNHDLLRSMASDLAVEYVNKGFSETDEYTADSDGLRLAMLAGYRPDPYIELLGKLPTGAKNIDHHPPAAERQARLKKWVALVTAPSKDAFGTGLSGVQPEQLALVPLKTELQAARE